MKRLPDGEDPKYGRYQVWEHRGVMIKGSMNQFLCGNYEADHRLIANTDTLAEMRLAIDYLEEIEDNDA